VFIGVKMLISPIVHLPVTVSLAVIVAVVGAAVGASLWRERVTGDRGRRSGSETRPVQG
jgi:predicted tellurium resistance membrane protein TerC